MTQQQASDLERALLRAHRRGIHILGSGRRKPDGVRVFLTNSGSCSDGTHFVTLVGQRLTCDCAARVVCVHRAVVHQRLLDERKRANTPVAGASSQPMSHKAGPEHAAPRRSEAPFSVWK